MVRIRRRRTRDVCAAAAARADIRRRRALGVAAMRRRREERRKRLCADRLGHRQLLDLRRVVDQVLFGAALEIERARVCVGCGCVGGSFSPGTFDGGAGPHLIGQIGSPVRRLNEYT